MTASSMDQFIKEEPTESAFASLKPFNPNQPPFRDACFEHAVTVGQQIAHDIYDVYVDAPRKPPPQLVQEARKLSQYRPPVERLVGIIGPSGAGKSSLICSLLDEEGIAITDASGSAVTCFPVVYKHLDGGYTAKYTMK